MNANLRVTPEKLRAKSQQFSTCDKTVQSLHSSDAAFISDSAHYRGSFTVLTGGLL